MKSYESINSLSSERKRSGGAATPRSIDEEATSTTPDLPEGTDDKSAPISLESIPAAVPLSEDEPYYDQVPADINDGEYVYIQAGMHYISLLFNCISKIFFIQGHLYQIVGNSLK